MEVNELLELTRRLDAVERSNQELTRLLVGMCTKHMDDKGVCRIEKPILDKVGDVIVNINQLKSGSIKLIVKKRKDNDGS